MQVLITGGAGYLGSILCRKLLDKGHSVRCLDALWYGREPIEDLLENPNFELIHDDIRNLITSGRAINGMDAVIHLASVVGMPASNIDPRLSEEINYLATKNLAELCELHGIENYIFASSCSVYGSQPALMITEKSTIRPVDYYAETKFKSERAINILKPGSAILRFGTLFGYSPRMRYDLVVNLFTASAIQHGKITVYGGEQYRPFLHVEDAADSLVFALEKRLEGTYNVVTMNDTIMGIANKIKSMTDCIINVTKNDMDKRDYMVSADKIKQMGFEPDKNLKYCFEQIRDNFNYDLTDKKYSNYKTLYDFKKNGKDVFIQL